MEMSRGMGQEAERELAEHWKAFMAAGVFLILVGCVSILVPALAAVAVTIFIGWILVAASIFLFASAFSNRDAIHLLVRVLWALVTLIAGLYLLIDPGSGTHTLTVILVIYFILMGVSRLAIAFAGRGAPNAGMVGVSGALSLLIGLLILVDLPNSKDWAIGLLVGIDLIFAGWVLTGTALTGRDLARGG